jgi:hypothetical protein
MTEKTKKFIKKLYERRPDLVNKVELIDEYQGIHKKIRFKDRYGVLLISPFHLLSYNTIPTIKLAENKSEYFIAKAKEIHGDKFGYNNINYINNREKIKLVCKVHGIFEISPDSHLRGTNCAKCEFNKNALVKVNSAKEAFIEKAKYKHGNKYDYSNFEYINAINKSTIICPIHGNFNQSAHDHLQGKGCRKCSIIRNKDKSKNNSYYNIKIADRNKDKWEQEIAYLYLIKCFNNQEEFYKVGICKEANKTKRFQYLKHSYEKIIMRQMSLYEAIILEQSIHEKLKYFKYIPKTRFGGYNECYSSNLPKEHIEFVQSIKLK